MVKLIDVEMPDGTIIEGVPEGITKAQLQAKLSKYQSAETDRPARGYGPARSVLQGMTFGFADEAGIGAAAAAAKATGDKRPISDIYREMKDSYNLEQQQYEKSYPVESTALEIGGGLSTGLAATPTAAGRFLAINPIKGGGIVGALAGAGAANTIEDIPIQSGAGALTGLATGGITRGLFGRSSLSPDGATPGLVVRMASGIRSLRGPEQAAAQVVGRDIRSSGMTPQQAAQQLDELGPEATLSDISDNLARTARTVYTQKGPGAEITRESLESRSIGGPQRVVADLKRITGKDTNFFETVKGVISNRKAESAPLYAEADKVNVGSNAIKSLHKQLLDKAEEATGTRLSGALKKFAGMLKSGDGWKTSVKQLDIVKRQTRDMVTRAYRSGDSDTGKELDGMLKILSNSNGTGILEKSSQAYRQANQIFSDESAVLKALESGRKVLSADADEVMENLTTLSLAEKDAFIQGAVKAIRDHILSGKKFSNDLVRERLRNAFPSDDAFKQFMSAVEREKTFAGTKGFVLGGSQTTNKASDIMDAAIQTGGVVQNAASGNYAAAAIGALRKVLGQNRIPERLHEPLAKALTTPEGSRRAVEILRKHGIGNPKPILDKIRTAVISAVPQVTPNMSQNNGNQIQQ